MAKKTTAAPAGGKKKDAKKGKAEVGKAVKAASGKKPEKKDASGKGAVKKEEEKKTAAKKVAAKEPAAKPAVKKDAKPVAKPAAKPAPAAKPTAKAAAGKAAKKAVEAPAKKSSAKKPGGKKLASDLPEDDEDELETGAVAADDEEGAEDEGPKDLDDDDLDIDPALAAAVVGEDDDVDVVDDIDVDPAEEVEEILPGVDLDVDPEAEVEGFGEKKEGGILARKVATGKKPKIITITATGPKKSLKLAPGLLKNTNKPPIAAQPAAGCACSNEADKKKEYRKLTKKEMIQIKDKLIAMREDILEKMRKELADTRQRAGTAPADLVDQAADAYDDDVSFEIASANDEDLEQIEAALERLAEGTYGLCEICNVPISPARLKILPFATRCVTCRGDFERTRSRRDSAGWNFFSEGEGAEADEGHEEEEE